MALTKGTALMQEGLASLGYDPGPVDGIPGPRTFAAIRDYLSAGGAPRAATADLPWMAEGKRVLGRHETRDKKFLSDWMKSDGQTLGDPAQLPWCGDFVETCIRLALRNEPLPGDLGRNPYWARNWALLGVPTEPTYGAVLVFSRDGGGHVGFCMGEEGGYFHVLGGNQSNMVSVARIAKSRMIAARWPSTYPVQPINLPRMSGGTITTNEV